MPSVDHLVRACILVSFLLLYSYFIVVGKSFFAGKNLVTTQAQLHLYMK